MENSTEVNKKKTNGFVKFIRGLFIVLGAIIVILAGWFVFSALDKKSSLTVVPENYSLFLHTDSVWNAVEPMLDLKAADTFLSDPQFSQFRKIFMSIKSSSLRDNKIVKFAGSRKADIALYTAPGGQLDYVVALDLSFISGVTRLLPLCGEFVFEKIGQDNIVYVKKAESGSAAGMTNFIIVDTGSGKLYIKPYKNLLVVTSSLNTFLKAFNGQNYSKYSAKEKKLLISKSNEPFKIAADSKQLIQSFVQKSPMMDELLGLLADNEKSTLEFGISDYEINIAAKLPFDFTDSTSSLVPVLSKNSTLPLIVSQLSDEVQYYTLLNIASLEELKDSALPLVHTKADLNKLWKQADSMCGTVLNATLEDILFSWTGKELAVFGLEGNKEPVFAIQVADEVKRRKVFEDMFSSFLISNNSSLIIGGVRLPCLELPAFLTNLLAGFGIDLPKPYYLVQGDYIYFSESAQNLSKIYNSVKNNALLSKTENFKAISNGSHSLSSVGMYYNLERSMPFFISNGTAVGKILKLYNIGRVDLRIKDNSLMFQLHAASVENTDLKLVPGFPIETGGRNNSIIVKSPAKNGRLLYWLENRNTVKSFDIDSLSMKSYSVGQNCSIIASSQKTSAEGEIWVTCANGAVYLLNSSLEPVEGFPVILDGRPSGESAVYNNSLVVPCADGEFYIVEDDADVLRKETDSDFNFKSAPAVYENTFIFYDRSFDGNIIIYNNNDGSYECLETGGIGSGTPSVAKIKGSMFIGFVTQSGDFLLYKKNQLVEGFPLNLDNVFSKNAVYFDGYFFVLANDATLYRISPEGEILTVKIPDSVSAKNGFMSVVKDGSEKGLYVCADSNIIYGFNRSMEVLNGFPVAGCGVPSFNDVNGDNKIDCIALSVDKKLYAWTIK